MISAHLNLKADVQSALSANAPLVALELTEVRRQTDSDFIALLSALREQRGVVGRFAGAGHGHAHLRAGRVGARWVSRQ